MSYICCYSSPLGKITMASDGEALTGLWFEGQKYFGSTLRGNSTEKELPVFNETKKWLDVYMTGEDPGKAPDILFIGTEFQVQVWNELLKIPYGKTVSYGEISKAIALQRGLKSMSSQAVGGVVSHNPISIIVPCHRVIGSDGKLTGYAGGLERKEKLLRIEKILR